MPFCLLHLNTMDSGTRMAGFYANIALAFAAASSAAAVFAASVFWRKSGRLASRIRELEIDLKASFENAASERRGRIRCQQSLRKGLTPERSDESGSAYSSYPMTPIGFVKSCFSTRNGTPRQPLLVPLARACLFLDPSRVPQEALEGLAEYSHCWILFVFHLNTNLEKLWNRHSRSKFKAKVRVPSLKGGKMGVLATRSPHRPCPIGLTVAKVDALDGRSVLLSGVDLVDGTPVLDIKPYLPYSDCIQGATVPKWVEVTGSLAVASVNFSSDFSSSLASCWDNAGQQSLYSCPNELQSLIKQVLSWDIRSLSQQSRPHPSILHNDSYRGTDSVSGVEDDDDARSDQGWNGCERSSSSSDGITYHLILEGVDISYKIDDNSNIMVEKATLSLDPRRQ